MKIITRTLERKILQLSRKFPIVAVLGPRQSGKTTLVRKIFPDHPYVSLEDIEIREYAKQDPKGFLSQYPGPVILDEVQRIPELFSYLQVFADESGKNGKFILTGSQNILMHEKISQTLAGRVALLKLLPLSLEELNKATLSPEAFMFTGGYPRLFKEKIDPSDWYPNYIQTYIERDLRLIKNIGDLSVFQKFLKMCAARTGQLLNLSSLAVDCGITHNTAKSWISILEASYILYLVYPHHQNFNKRLVKTPKLYFFDTGVACSLLGLTSKDQLQFHYLKGNIFETLIMNEIHKYYWNRGASQGCFFWRDKTGREVDCILEKPDGLIPVEIKSGATIAEDYFENLHYWNKLNGKNIPSYVVYGGKQHQKRNHFMIFPWNSIHKMLEEL